MKLWLTAMRRHWRLGRAQCQVDKATTIPPFHPVRRAGLCTIIVGVVRALI
jgi:hypothetical protein